MKITEDMIRRIAREEAEKSLRNRSASGVSAAWVEENFVRKDSQPAQSEE